jgi:hypothetical protein
MTPTAQICKNVGPLDNVTLNLATTMTIAYALMILLAKTTFVSFCSMQSVSFALLILLDKCATRV